MNTPSNKVIKWLLGIMTFFIPFIIYRLTSVNALMFDDAAEFALVIKLASIAHPPGTPAYILLGHLWVQLTSFFGMQTIDSLNMFASVSLSTASLLLYITFNSVSKIITDSFTIKNLIIAAVCAIGFSTGQTAWAWGNTIEVYSFQALTFSIAILGLTRFQISNNIRYVFLAALGIGLGLANHHLTMITFLPFTFFFFTKDLFKSPIVNKSKKQNTDKSFIGELIRILKSKEFIALVITTTIVMCFFYGWMYLRAQQEYPFMFGKPDTITRLFYHLKGGSYSKNLTSASGSIISSRLPYFLKLTFLQLLLFFPFFLLGIYYQLKLKLNKLTFIVFGYFLILFIYQLNNNQWSSTDAYMLLPFYFLMFPVFIGCILLNPKIKLTILLPIFLVIQIAINLKDHNRKTYNVSTSLMQLLDKSSPKNSVILISDWTTIIQYYYFRIVENFRPDLVVLNYDMKFTHYRILPILYPQFYQKIKPEYDSFVSELKKEHPEQISNTGCDLSTTRLTELFRNLILKTQDVCKVENRYFLTDPKAHYFFSNQKFYDPRRFVSGCFMSSIPGDSISAATFLPMNFPFLKSPLLLNDPSALDKIVDFQAMLDSHIEFYKLNSNPVSQQEAENAREKILRLQRDLKRSMSFAYKVK